MKKDISIIIICSIKNMNLHSMIFLKLQCLAPGFSVQRMSIVIVLKKISLYAEVLQTLHRRSPFWTTVLLVLMEVFSILHQEDAPSTLVKYLMLLIQLKDKIDMEKTFYDIRVPLTIKSVTILFTWGKRANIIIMSPYTSPYSSKKRKFSFQHYMDVIWRKGYNHKEYNVIKIK
jgi:hypothetical protein